MPKIRNDSWYEWMLAWQRVRRFLYDTGTYGDNDVSTIEPRWYQECVCKWTERCRDVMEKDAIEENKSLDDFLNLFPIIENIDSINE